MDTFRKGSNEIIKNGEKRLSIEACGSFRRGRPTCGDIDVLITYTDGTDIKGLCEKLVCHLESKGFLKSVDGGTTWTNLGLVGERITAVAVWPCLMRRMRPWVCVCMRGDTYSLRMGRKAL